MAIWAMLASDGRAHPGAINLFVDTAAGGKLFPLPNYEPGAFVLYPGIELSSETPGITVTFPANGLAAGTRLDLEIQQGLLFWDGSNLTAPATSLRVQVPAADNEGHLIESPVSSYLVSEDSRVLQGMHWGTYSGNSFWEADGLFFLESMSAPHGVYGLVYRVNSVSYRSSEPFLVPFVFDPTNRWTLAQRQEGIQLLKTAVRPQSGDFDDDGDFDCGDVDSLVAAIGQTSPPLDFDLTWDGQVDGDDLEVWLADAGSARLASHQPLLPGDANLDGLVDGSDFSAWNAFKFTQRPSWCSGDFNADGFVDGSDFNTWNGAKFTASARGGVLVVGEPVLSLGAVFAAAIWAWRAMRDAGWGIR